VQCLGAVGERAPRACSRLRPAADRNTAHAMLIRVCSLRHATH